MSGRLIVAILSNLLEEAALAVIVLWGLPQFGYYLPLPGLITLMVLWLAVSVFIYRAGSRALRLKPVFDLPLMIGSKGKVVSPLVPDGLVRIKGELWMARARGKQIEAGAEIIIIDQDGLKLVVRRSS
jgi:membrane-bound ClpP family serine protease